MVNKEKTTSAEKLNAGVKSIINNIEASCDKIKALEDNKKLHDQMQRVIDSLSTKGENIDYAAKISNIEELVKNERSFFLKKTGVSPSNLLETKSLEDAAKILQEAGIDDYKSNSLYMILMDIIETHSKQKKLIYDVDEYIHKIKKVADLQDDLISELSMINYSLVCFKPKQLNITPKNGINKTLENRNEIVEKVKQLSDLEKKQMDVCKKTTELKEQQKKLYHGLPPNLEQTTMAVRLAEQQMKSITKKLIEKLNNKD